MISKGHNKTQLEKDWLKTVVDFAESTKWLKAKYGAICYPNQFEIDHILGARTKRKINGVSWRVGELAIMPIPTMLHNVMSNHKYNRTTQPANYRAVFGHETQVWLSMVWEMEVEGYTIPFSEDVINAIVKR